MPLLKFKPFLGTHTEQFQDPDTGQLFKEGSRRDLIARIVAYRTQNDLETIESLGAVIDNYQCGLPENKGKCIHYENKDFKRGWLTYIKGGITLLKMVMFSRYVSQEQANVRAKQCKDCPLNGYPEDIKGKKIEEAKLDQYMDFVASKMVGDKSTPYDDLLKKCAGCTCILRAAVHAVPPHDLTPEQTAKMKVYNCWKVIENGN